MRAVCAYVGTLPKCMQVFARSVRGGDSEAIEQTISNFCAQNIILCVCKIIRKVWDSQTIGYICRVLQPIQTLPRTQLSTSFFQPLVER